MEATEKKILIIDDDARNIFALSAVLRARGFNCVSASGMKEAFVILMREPDRVGAILLDMMMPEMDGYEALPILKENDLYAHIPVIAVTAQAMLGDREKCLSAGADGYVSKPVNIDELLPILDQIQ
jgi:two-component system cell cycle response regulator DivK